MTSCACGGPTERIDTPPFPYSFDLYRPKYECQTCGSRWIGA